MGIFKRSAKYVSRRTGELGSLTGRNLGRLGSNFAGTFSSSRRQIVQLKLSMRNYVISSTLDSRKVKKAIRAMHRSKRHIIRYRTKELPEIDLRYEGHPKEMERATGKVAGRFLKDFSKFVNAYHEFLKAVLDQLNKTNALEMMENNFIVSTLSELNTRARNAVKGNDKQALAYFREESIEMVIPKFEEMCAAKIRQIREESDEVIEVEDRLEREKREVLDSRRYKYRFFRVHWFEHKYRKYTSWFKHRKFRKMGRNVAEIQKQLQGEVQTSIFQRIIEYIDQIERTDEVREEIYFDLRHLIDVVGAEYEETLVAATEFVANTRATGKFKEMKGKIAEFQALHAKLQEILENSTKAQLYTLYRQVVDIKNRGVFILRHTEDWSRKAKEAMRSNSAEVLNRFVGLRQRDIDRQKRKAA